MTLHHPFERLPPEELRRWFITLLAGTLATGAIVLAALGPPEKLESVLALVTAGNVADAERVLVDWSAGDRIRLAFVGGFDFLFGLLWTSTFALACVWGSRVFRSPPLRRLGIALAWLAWFGYLLDFPENFAYVTLVHGSAVDPLPWLGAVAFQLRWLILFALDAYVTLAGVAWLVQRRTGSGAGSDPSTAGNLR